MNHDKKDLPQSKTSSILQSPKCGLKGHGYSLHLQNQERVKIQIIIVSKTSVYIQNKIKMSNPSQDPPKPQLRT